MTKQPHPADLADRQKVATATHFNVHLRRNPGDVVNTEAATLIDAVKIADEMGTMANGKKPMIYAVTPDRQSVFVPADMIDEARKDIAEIGAGLSGTEIAKLAAMITGGGFKRSKSKTVAEARFIKIATEAGFANAADIVRGPFDFAEHVIREKLAGKALTIDEVKGARNSDDMSLSEIADKIDETNPTAGRTVQTDDGPVIAKVKPASGKRAAILEAAQRGELPAAPDFSAPTHARFRKKLAEIVALAEAGDVPGLKAITINPVSSSPKAMDKYRNLAVIALESRHQKDAA